jgi:chemotaxis signal transduction protein
MSLSSSRYIMTEVRQASLAFPAAWVREVLLVDPSRLLRIPFYHPAILGVVHHQGEVVPLAEIPGSQGGASMQQGFLTVIRLGRLVGSLTGLGIVVDRVMGNVILDPESSTQIFTPADLPTQLWYPQ